ncbi:hypothetical protein HZS_7559 [Henneguya salminicola]|nr:hypothetical protein HZS_7559 [Henneguya salminicola]
MLSNYFTTRHRNVHTHARVNKMEILPMSQMPYYVDIGVNLNDDMFKGIYHGKKIHDEDLEGVIERASSFNVKYVSVFFLNKMINLNGNLSESINNILLLQKYCIRIFCCLANIFHTVGVHPTRCMELEVDGGFDYIEKLIDFIKCHQPQIIAIGEIGLGNADEVELLVLNGFSIGITGCSLREASTIEAISVIPLDRILIETGNIILKTFDSPWCTIGSTFKGFSYIKSKYPTVKAEKYDPNSFIKGRNEPALIREIYEAVAVIKNVSLDNLIEKIAKNVERIFKLF